MVAFFGPTVIYDDIKATRHRDDELFEFFMGMAATFCPARNIVEVVDAFDFEGCMPVALDKGQIAAWVMDDRQIDKLAVFDRHEGREFRPEHALY